MNDTYGVNVIRKYFIKECGSMFKVHLKFASHNMWIRLSEILKVYRMDTEDYTVISFKNAVHVYVTESVEEILAAINSEV